MIMKKLIASITSLAMIFTTVFCGLAVPVNAAETESSDMSEITEVTHEFYRDPETGHIGMVEPLTYDLKSRSNAASDEIVPNSALPSSFASVSSMYKFYPATRSQSPYGTCWAHAATACAEFDLVKNHGYSKSTDFSELQLAWFHYNTGKTLTGLDGDKAVIHPYSEKHYLDMGGNIVYSMHTLSQWKTYTYESSIPYSLVKNNKYYSVNSSYSGTHNAGQFRGCRILDIKNNRNSVKQAIVDHGAVYISYNSNNEYYYNFRHNDGSIQTYYNNKYDTTTNHDIVIVGWDDSINAWLARNSWSVSSSGNSSSNTYFWLYYYDKSLNPTAYVLDYEPGSTSDNLYQYDGAVTHNLVNTSSAANIFTTSQNGSYCEKLDSVMVSFSTVANVRYKVEIYKNPTTGNPKSGTLQSSATTTGYTTDKGIYTIDLKNPVYLSPQERFSVVVTILDSKGKACVGKFEIEKSRDVTYTQNGVAKYWIDSDAYTPSGCSYVYLNSKWKDTATYGSGYGNIRIKAITSDTNLRNYTVSYQLDGGTNNSANPSYFRSDASGTFTLKEPTKAGYHFLGWYSDSSFTNKVTYLNYNNKTNQTFYARWCSNSNPEIIKSLIKPASTSSDGSYKSYCTGCGLDRGTLPLYKITSIGLSSTKENYPGGSNSPVPVVKDRAGNVLTAGTDYTYTYNKSNRKNVGRYSVTIRFNGASGKYSGNAVTKAYTVVPAAPTSISASLYGYDDVKVSWSKSTGASGYYVYYKKASSSKYVLYKRTTNRYMKIPNLSDYVKYNFKVVPYYYYPTNKTRYTSLNYKAVSTTTLKKMSQPSISKTGDGRVTLKWNSITGASGYQVYWSASKSGTYKKLCDYSNNYIGVTFTVGKNKAYWYKVRAYRKVGTTKVLAPFSTPKAYTFR